MKTIYLSGKIAGLKPEEADENFHVAFEEAKNMYLDKEVNVINPLCLASNSSFTWSDYIIRDLLYLAKCDAIYMLKDWQDSPGARVEHEFAKGLGIEIIYQDKTTRL